MPTDETASLRPGRWTPIAWRPRFTDGGVVHTWTTYLDAPFNVMTARRLLDSRRILMANRHNGDRVELVVRPVDHGR